MAIYIFLLTEHSEFPNLLECKKKQHAKDQPT